MCKLTGLGEPVPLSTPRQSVAGRKYLRNGLFVHFTSHEPLMADRALVSGLAPPKSIRLALELRYARPEHDHRDPIPAHF
jgi:hypothetical protein